MSVDAPKKTTAVVAFKEKADQLTKLAAEYGPAAMAGLDHMTKAMQLARGCTVVMKVVGEALPYIRPLAGSPLGFRTDKDAGPGGGSTYSDEVIQVACTEAVLRGLNWTGNEFNIISGRLYVTREGYTRLVSELEGLTDLALRPGVPKMMQTGAEVPYSATWKINGKQYSMETVIPVRLNTGMGADGALGKAQRKMLARIHAQVTGSTQSLDDGSYDAIDENGQVTRVAPAVASKTADLAARLGAAKPPEVAAGAAGAGNGALFGSNAGMPD